MSFITVKHLNKTFKVYERKNGLKGAFKSLIKRKVKLIHAVDDISFDIKKGEIVGYIGPNGAGKSTTIKMLCGILKPDSGEVSVAGFNPFQDRVKYVKNIGVVFGQKSQLWWDIPVIDTFELLKDIYKIKDEDYKKNLNELIELLQLEKFLHTPVRQLSLGERMRCEICASLLHNPKILFLDEPTIGLDAVSKVRVRKFIKEINKKRKCTIILTSHDMQDIESLTNRLIVIGHGKKLYDGTLSGIKHKYSSTKKLEILYNNLIEAPVIEDVSILKKEKNRILLEVNNNQSISNIVKVYSDYCEIKDINVINKTIDEIIYELYKEMNL